MLTDYEVDALLLSLKISSMATLISLPFGLFFGWILARKKFVGKTLLDSILNLPLVLPPVVIGYLLLISLGREGIIGKYLFSIFGIVLGFSWQGAVIAVGIISFPLLVRSIRLGIEAVDTNLEQAARTLGANEKRVFLTITLPLALPGLITGIVLSFARSLGEFGATITFVSNIPQETQTIPLAMYSFIETPGGESSAARLCLISISIALLSIFISEFINRRNMKKLRGEL